MKRSRYLTLVLGVIVMCTPLQGLGATWQPQKPIEFIIPAGPGGGADVMARFIAPLVSKYNLSPQPLVAANRPGGAGAEGFLYVKAKSSDPQSVHHSSGDQSTVQLEGLHTTRAVSPG